MMGRHDDGVAGSFFFLVFCPVVLQSPAKKPTTYYDPHAPMDGRAGAYYYNDSRWRAPSSPAEL